MTRTSRRLHKLLPAQPLPVVRPLQITPIAMTPAMGLTNSVAPAQRWWQALDAGGPLLTRSLSSQYRARCATIQCATIQPLLCVGLHGRPREKYPLTTPSAVVFTRYKALICCGQVLSSPQHDENEPKAWIGTRHASDRGRKTRSLCGASSAHRRSLTGGGDVGSI